VTKAAGARFGEIHAITAALVEEHGPCFVADLCERTLLPAAMVTSALADLVREHYIISTSGVVRLNSLFS